MHTTTINLLTKSDLEKALKDQTDPQTRSAKPYSLPVGGVAGLSVQIFPGNSSRATYSLFYRVAGQAKRFKIGYFPTTPIAEARKRAQKALNRIADGGDPQAERKAAKKKMTTDTVASVVPLFVEKYCKAKGNRTCLRSLHLVKSHWVTFDTREAVINVHPT